MGGRGLLKSRDLTPYLTQVLLDYKLDSDDSVHQRSSASSSWSILRHRIRSGSYGHPKSSAGAQLSSLIKLAGQERSNRSAHSLKVMKRFFLFYFFFFRSPKFDFVRSAATSKLALSSKLLEIDLFEVADHLSCLRCNWFLSIESFHSFRGRMVKSHRGDFVYLNLIWLRTGESGESDPGDPPAARTGASLGDSTGGQSERSHADQRPIAAIIPPSAAHWRPVATLSARWLCRWTAFARYEKEPHFFFLHTRVLSTIFLSAGEKKEKKFFILKRLLIFSFSSSSSSLGCDDVQFMLERTPAARVSVESSPRSNSKWKLPTASRPRELFFFSIIFLFFLGGGGGGFKRNKMAAT